MAPVIISPLEVADDAIEIVERKGLGHPDTICDALAETFSRNLCREYRRRFGTILHHNVDKALLSGGRAEPAFRGGKVLAPINIYLAGRATSQVGNDALAISEIAVEGSKSWLRENLHALDAERHVRIHDLVQPGSHDLRDLFSRQSRSEIPLANDTSIGVGYAPRSRLEDLVLAIEKQMIGRMRTENATWGEDIKIMGIRNENAVHLTVACALIGRHVQHIDGYLAEKASIKALVQELAARHGFEGCEIAVNSADDPSTGSIYLTVTGTSAEAGDDGEVGRGNRVNGLITPGRPMSLEAAAGKNPVTHVGKIYNVLSRDIAEALTLCVPQIARAHCIMVSRIGAPITRPALLQLRLATRDRVPADQLRPRVQEIADHHLARIPELIDGFVAGTIEVF